MYSDENILYFNADSMNVVFSYNETSVPKIDLKSINLDNNIDEDNPNTISIIRLLAW